MRIDCDVPGFEHCFIEMSERWTRREMRDFWTIQGEEYLALIARKTVSLHLETDDGDSLTSPADLTEVALDQLDYLLFSWFNTVPIITVQELQRLGEATRRRLYVKAGDSAALETATPTPS